MNVKVGTHTFLNLHALHATGSSYFYRMKYFVSRNQICEYDDDIVPLLPGRAPLLLRGGPGVPHRRAVLPVAVGEPQHQGLSGLPHHDQVMS